LTFLIRTPIFRLSEHRQRGFSMLKLKKTSGASWAGNGFGTNAADWVVADHEHIAVKKFAGIWVAADSSRTKKVGHLDVPVRIATAYTRADLLKILTIKLAA